MQAPKNGFFYVLDRATGELISAAPYTEVTWATGIDMKTGRPIETPNARYTKPEMIKPGPLGGHNWQPMSFNPQTGLVYIPAQDDVVRLRATIRSSSPRRTDGTLGVDSRDGARRSRRRRASLPSASCSRGIRSRRRSAGACRTVNMWNGGTLTTGGQSRVPGHRATAASPPIAPTPARKLWEMPVGSPIIAAPITYEIDGTQYVAVMAGWGGSPGSVEPAGAAVDAGPAAGVRARRQSARSPPLTTTSRAGARADRGARGIRRETLTLGARHLRAPLLDVSRRRGGQRRADSRSPLLAAGRRSIATPRSCWAARSPAAGMPSFKQIAEGRGSRGDQGLRARPARADREITAMATPTPSHAP